MNENILILDFGSQYTQLIARRLRELNVYCEIFPYNKLSADLLSAMNPKGVILSGSPYSVLNAEAPQVDLSLIRQKYPVLGVCYGAQYIAYKAGGKVVNSTNREYGRANINVLDENDDLVGDLTNGTQVWMSHGDTIFDVPGNFECIASTKDVTFAAYRVKGEKTYGIQFHPEVYHSVEGSKLLKNFAVKICGCTCNWTPQSFVDVTVKSLREQIGNDNVILGLSGGVDSSVAAVLLNKAVGTNLHCIFVDNGLLRKGEFEEVLNSYKQLGLNVLGIDAKNDFYEALKGITDPEQKRKAIGKTFIDAFTKAAESIKNVKWLAQGTIYPDVIESSSVNGPSSTIKSHHNVGGLPKELKFKIVEPLRYLFKDEVRRIGTSLNMPDAILGRHPFPGPGLGIRIIGEVTRQKVQLLQEVDAIFINGLKTHNLYDTVWQAFAVLLPVKSVGVMGDEKTYDNVVALRAVSATDGMTADWSHLPYEFLAQMSNDIINKVKGVNRVVYDISSKPPATIEWE